MEESIKYVRKLQREFSSQLSGSIEDVLKYRKKQFNLNEKEINKLAKKFKNRSFLKYQEKMYNQRIAKPFIEALPDDVREKLKDVYIGILPTYKINASVLKGPNDKPIIILHSQLLTAISHYNETQLLYGKKIKKSEKQAVDFLVNSYSEISKCFVYSNYAPRMSMLPTKLNMQELSYAYQKTILQELFIIAHECAHVYLGHLNKIETKKLPFSKKNTEIDEYIKRQKFELEADLQAIKWIVEISNNKKINNTLFFLLNETPYIAIEIFMLFHMLEVNKDGNESIIPNIDRKLDIKEMLIRQVEVFKEVDDLISKDIINDINDHPKAIVRMVHAICNTVNLFDKKGQELLLGMLDDSVYYETFKFNSLI